MIESTPIDLLIVSFLITIGISLSSFVTGWVVGSLKAKRDTLDEVRRAYSKHRSLTLSWIQNHRSTLPEAANE